MLSEREYVFKLKKLRQDVPEHGLLGRLESGYSQMNALLLEKAVSGITLKVAKERKQANKAAMTARDLYRQARNVMGRMSAASNEFHKCSTNLERAAVSDKLMMLHAEIYQLYEEAEKVKKNPAYADKVHVMNSGDHAKLILERQKILGRIKYRAKELGKLKKNAINEEDTEKLREKHQRKKAELEKRAASISRQIDQYIRLTGLERGE